MFLTPSQHQALRKCFALLAEDHNEREIREQIGLVMLDLFGADQFASFVWNSEERKFVGAVAHNMDRANLRKYEAYYQYHDPITLLLQSRRHATLVSEVLPRAELLRTEFFNDFLARDGLHWGINLHAFDGNEALGDLRIWRGRHRHEFDQRDKDLLDMIEPAFVAALKRAREARKPQLLRSGGALDMLSPREYAVAVRVCRGMTNKEIARELSLSLPSVNTYLQRIFEKTGIRRRAALANLEELH